MIISPSFQLLARLLIRRHSGAAPLPSQGGVPSPGEGVTGPGRGSGRSPGRKRGKRAEEIEETGARQLIRIGSSAACKRNYFYTHIPVSLLFSPTFLSDMEVPAVNLKAIIFVHWLLTIWGCMELWVTSSYAWSNFTVLALGVWAVAQRDSVDAILMFLTGLFLTIITDIIHLSLYFPQDLRQSDTLRFATGMAIFSLILKPVSCFFVYQMYRERGGEYTFNLGGFGTRQDRSTYQPIDTPDPPRPYPDVKAAPPHPF